MRENNELIAEFMGGYNVDPNTRIHGINLPNRDDGWYDIHELEYDTSWDWLMPVVQRCKNLGCIVEITMSLAYHCRITKLLFPGTNIVFEYENNSMIDAVYQAVYEFIQYTTKQQEQKHKALPQNESPGGS